ncbi:MAG: hypothetical protein IPP03_15820 [Dechloromonas sp.]|nr:hypothetical protein [Candidatus Dechloromonas phosphoritropha]
MGDIFGLLQELRGLVVLFKGQVEIQHDWVSPLVFALFTFMNSIRIFAYLPQIIKVTKDENGASAISYSTWALFFLSHLATVAYAVFCVGDPVMALIFFGNASACFVLLLATFVKRRNHAIRLLADLH